MRAENAFALVGGAGAFRIEPCRRLGVNCGVVDALADADAAAPAGVGFFGFGDGAGVEERLGFLEILPGRGFTEAGFVKGHGRIRLAEIWREL